MGRARGGVVGAIADECRLLLEDNRALAAMGRVYRDAATKAERQRDVLRQRVKRTDERLHEYQIVTNGLMVVVTVLLLVIFYLAVWR